MNISCSEICLTNEQFIKLNVYGIKYIIYKNDLFSFKLQTFLNSSY